MAEFVLGIAAEAARLKDLGIDIGEPLADEHYLKNPDGADVLSLQPTTKGLFIYDPAGNMVYFLEALGK